MVDFRNYINPQPRGKKFTAAWQLEPMAEGTMYVEDKTGKIIGSLIKSVREGSIVQVRRLFCLAPWSGKPKHRREAMSERLDAIEDKGGAVLEAETQRRSDARGQRNKMLMDGLADIATAGRANPRSNMGRPSKDYTAQQEDAMARIWFSSRYRTGADKVAALHSLGIIVSAPYMYRRFGIPTKPPANAAEIVPVLPPKTKRHNGKSYIYFVRSGNAVKIGISCKPSKRVKSMATGNHGELKLLATIPGNRSREKALHRKFKAHRIKGEWFNLDPAILRYINGVKKSVHKS